MGLLAFLIALPALILSLVMLARLNSMSHQLRELRQRLQELQDTLAASPRPPQEKPETRAAKAEKPATATTPPSTIREPKPEPGSEPASQPGKQPEPQSRPEPKPQPAAEPVRQPPPATTPSGETLEQLLGARWSVWLGMLALSLGGIFLVKYSIEAGLLTPAVRIALGAAFSALLLALGEFARRRELASPLPFLPQAHIPGALTASGIISAYATTLAAHALYGFLSAPAAFAILALVSFAALALALRHGPLLAALGLLGATAVPFLIGGGRPVVWLLLGYHFLVAAATAALASARNWRWLGIAAIGAALGIAGLFAAARLLLDNLPLAIAYLAGLMLLTTLFVHDAASHDHLAEHPDLSRALPALTDIPATVLIALAMAGIIPLAFTHHFATPALLFAAIPLAFGMWLAFRYASLALLLPWAGVLALLLLVLWVPRSIAIIAQTASGEDDPLQFLQQETRRYLAAAVLLPGTIALAALAAARQRFGQPLFAATAAAIAPLAFLLAVWRTTGFTHTSLRAGFIALLLAILFAALADHFLRRGEKGLKQPRYFEISGSLLAATATAFLALTFTLTLERGWLTIAFALLVPALVWIANLRKVAILHYLALAFTGIVVLRILYDPAIMGADVGSLPIFNWLLYGYGIPALAFWLASRLSRSSGHSWIADALESAALFFLTLLIVLQIRHLTNGGNIYAPGFTLAENALHTLAFLALSVAQGWFARRSGRRLPQTAAYIFLGLSLLSFIGGQLLLNNPLLTDLPATTSTLILAYLIPAALLALRAWLEPQLLPRQLLGATALFSLLAFITLVIRQLYHPIAPAWWHGAWQQEWISYSIAWLLFALTLLAAGLWLRHRELRMAGLALLALVVIKVFLSDMAHLSGIWRALSFIGLGLSLLAIGWAYQRLVLPPDRPDEENDTPPSQEQEKS